MMQSFGCESEKKERAYLHSTEIECLLNRNHKTSLLIGTASLGFAERMKFYKKIGEKKHK